MKPTASEGLKKLKYEELKRRLVQGVFDPLYLFVGEELYLIDEAIRYLRSHALTKEEQETNFHNLYADELEFDEFLGLAKSIPFVGKNRLIVLNRIDKLKKTEELIGFVKRKHSRLYLILAGEKFNFQTKAGQSLAENATVVQFYKLFDNQVPSWILQRVKQDGRQISMPLAQMIAEILGNDLSRISNELAKVYLYMGQEKEIIREHLMAISAEARLFSVFDLLKNIVEKKRDGALRVLDKLMEEGESSLMILTMMVRQFRHLYLAKTLIQQGKGVTEIARACESKSTFAAQQIIDQARLFSLDQIQGMYYRFLEIDLQLKSSSCPHRLILENLLLEMCGK